MPYSVWRYEKGGGYKILNHLIPIFKNRFKVSSIVTTFSGNKYGEKVSSQKWCYNRFSSDNFVNYRYL